MSTEFFIKGLIIGFSIAAPVGPIGLLTIRRTLASGWANGFATGMGAATADAVYGAIAAFGLTAISGVLVAQQAWLRIAGGLFLLYLGVQTFRSQPAVRTAETGSGAVLKAWASATLLTLTNPATILSFVAVFAGLGLGQGADYAGAAQMVLGVFLGSAAWWLLLCGATAKFRERLGPARLVWVNRGSGLLLAGFGLLALFV